MVAPLHGLCVVWPQVLASSHWSIGNGEKVRSFWNDNWLDDFSPLISYVLVRESWIRTSTDKWRLISIAQECSAGMSSKPTSHAWRNRRIFEDGQAFQEDPIVFILRQGAESEKALSLKHFSHPGNGNLRTQHLCWKPPPDGTMKVNTDGERSIASGVASSGDVIKNAQGAWIAGFRHRISCCTSLCAELWATITGLEMAILMGFKNIQLLRGR
ncbi:hypothetical protein RCOM_1761740 [Ricinus communis]|uniref:RNase H type-1 domain-containing protein n=1 Tax=Ricinus communis TaxID=3988 RepID=B9RHM3_RICCO|nr:hypothetical protein RCOM_1761740 [Ricinus communis]